MIQNKRQYQITRKCAREFEESIDAVQAILDSKDLKEYHWKYKINRDAMQSQLDTLRAEIKEWESRCRLKKEKNTLKPSDTL